MTRDNKFAYLLAQLQISGKELSIALHINVTLLSKYRNQKRKMNQQVASDIAAYVVNEHVPQSRSMRIKLLEILSPFAEKNIETYTTEELIELLTEYLLDTDVEKIVYVKNTEQHKAVVDLFSGRKGWWESYERFKNMVCADPGDEKTIYIGDFHSISFEDPQNYELYIHASEICTDMVNAGLRLVLLTSVRVDYKSYTVLPKWLQLYARENVYAYYIEDFFETKNKYSMVVDPGKRAFVGLDTNTKYSEDMYVITEDETMVNFCYGVLREVQEHVKPMLHKVKIFEQQTILDQIKENITKKHSLYFLDSMPNFRNMPEDLLREVLKENRVEGELYELCLRYHKQWKKIYENELCKLILDIHAIEATLEKDKISYYELSYLTGKEISISNEQFRRHLQFMIDSDIWSDNQIGFVSFESLELAYDYITMIVQGDSLLWMWNAPDSANCLVYDEPSLIGGCRRYVHEIWHSMSGLSKNRKLLWERIGYSEDR